MPFFRQISQTFATLRFSSVLAGGSRGRFTISIRKKSKKEEWMSSAT